MIVEDWGLVPYQEAWDRQIAVFAQVAAGGDETLILVEHPPVLTLGAAFHPENLLLSERQYASLGIDIVTTDRGGDVTFHGPGQLVAYPIFDLARRDRDVHSWMRNLEEVLIQTCVSFGLSASRFPPNTGVWVGDKKVAAIGVKIKKWISMHGIAINCDNDLHEFDLFVPCGIQGYGVTSLSELLSRQVTVREVKPCLVEHFRTA